MNKQPPSTRICSMCGQEKTLIAFMKLAGSLGHIYGDICASCRGTETKPTAQEKSDSETTGDTTREQLDSKAKLKMEQDKKKQFKQQVETQEENKEKKETIDSTETSKTNQREKSEKQHRDEYLQSKQGFHASPKTEKNRTTSPQHTSTTESEHRYQEQQWSDKQESAKQEFKNTSTDLSVGVFLDSPTSTVKRSAGSVFSQFRNWLGSSAAMNKSMQAYNQKNQEVKPLTSHSLKESLREPQAEKLAEKKKDLVEEFISHIKRR